MPYLVMGLIIKELLTGAKLRKLCALDLPVHMSKKPRSIKYFENYIGSQYQCDAVWVATVPMHKAFRPHMNSESIVPVVVSSLLDAGAGAL